MNLLKSELRYSTLFRSAKATNKGESAYFAHFRSTLRQSPPKKAGLKCPFVNPSVRRPTFVRPQKVSSIFFDFNEIWPVGRVDE